MASLPILKMGDPRLLQVAEPVRDFDTPELHGLIADLFDTMAVAGGVGLAATQVGISSQVVVFGFEKSVRYPEAEPVPMTVLINPVITPLGEEEEEGWEG
ncbi:MAG: peptide deformylase, partial [Actinomycetota bacterium]